MSPEKWKEIKQLFTEVADLSPAEQQARLNLASMDQEVRIEVEKMLAADGDESLLASPFDALAIAESADFIGKKFGHYRILREVGRGGMGTVFAALRDDGEFEQRAAVKLIKRGLISHDIVRRFRRERQILATLTHPNIARLLDGGMSKEGLPFYVMEYIEGEPIDRYCLSRNLPLAARLELFLEVCEAVSYAHRRLVVHRDLKPSNILVTENGQVKLLDFGIAKLVSQDASDSSNTATQLGMMTPDYASPEQFRGDPVTTATDVYSLGIVLYELLTSTLPFELNGLRLDQMLRLVCETEPPRPSESSRQKSRERWRNPDLLSSPRTPTDASPYPEQVNTQALKGDLDNIILKALKKEPERRYESVEQFSTDIRRYLQGLPVSARPDTFAYRASKFISRNKLGVFAVTLIFLAMLGGILGFNYQAQVAQKERERAEKRFEQVRKLANNVVFKYHDAIAALPGATATREMLVKDAIEYLDNLSEDAQDNPALAEELALAYLKIGNVQGETYRANLGDSAGAMESYRKSVEIFEKLVRANPAHTGYLKNLHEASQSTTFLLVRLQQWQEAEATGDRLLEIGERLVGLAPGNQDFQNLLARSYQIKGDTAEFSGGDEVTIQWYRRSLEAAERLVAKDPSEERGRRILTVAMQRLGTRLEYYAEILREKGEPDSRLSSLYLEAEQLHRRTVELAEGLRRDFPQNEIYSRFVAATSINLGTAMARTGNGVEGIEYLYRSLERLRAISQQDPKNNEAKRDIAELWQYVAFSRMAMREPLAAIEADQKSLRILEEVTANDPSNFEFLKQTHMTYNHAGDILSKQGKLAEAMAYFQKGMEFAIKMASLNNSSQIAVLRSESQRKIGETYLALGEKYHRSEYLDSAFQYLTKALDELEQLRQRNELGKNYEHKLVVLKNDLGKVSTLKGAEKLPQPRD
jgi:eukaryotic-like serine/threonine-protein kinase